jgi:nucleotide-binding universal stress UspA family protein
MRIMIVSNGALNAEATLSLARQFTPRAGEPATLLTVIRPGARGVERPDQAWEPLLRAPSQADAPEVRTKIRIGRPAEQIILEAREGNYDLVILGDRKEGNPVSRFRPGAIALRVVDYAPCPVLVTRGRVGVIRRILLCDSGVESPSLLTRFVSDLTSLLEGEEEVTILHVMSQISAGPGVRGVQLRASAADLIREDAPEGRLLQQDLRVLARPGIHPKPQVRHGLVVDEILAEARGGDYDLVVIGAHRSNGWQGILLENLAHRLLAELDRPILVVR